MRCSLVLLSAAGSAAATSLEASTGIHEALHKVVTGQRHVLHNDNREWLSMLQKNVNIKDWLASSGSKLPSVLAGLFRAEAEGTEAAYAKQNADQISKAVVKVQGMIADVTNQIDDIIINDCEPYDIFHNEAIDKQEQKKNAYISERQQVQGNLIAANNVVTANKAEVVRVQGEMNEDQAQYDKQTATLTRQKNIVDQDLTIFEVLFNATTPSGGEYDDTDNGPEEAKDSFVQKPKVSKIKVCKDENRDPDKERPDDAIDLFDSGYDVDIDYVLLDTSMREHASRMSTFGRRLMSKHRVHTSETAVLAKRNKRHREEAADEQTPATATDDSSATATSTTTTAVPPVKPEDASAGAAGSGCVADKSADAVTALNVKMGSMLGKARDSSNKLGDDLEQNQKAFKARKQQRTETLESLNTQILSQQSAVKNAESRLSALATQIQKQEQIVTDLKKERDDKRSACRERIRTLVQMDLCALLRVRNNVVERFMKLDPLTAVQDCQVSKWDSSGPCSVLCGGGQRTVKRVVTNPPNANGAGCPKLQFTMKCNEQNCPRNCKVDIFGAWTKCNADCGSGTMTRTRRVLEDAEEGGTPCPALMEESTCNAALPCDRDCILKPWEQDSYCTRGCKNLIDFVAGVPNDQLKGRNYQRRPIDSKPLGRGAKCAARSAWGTRLTYGGYCNDFFCDFGIRCIQKRDLIIAVDSSWMNSATEFDNMKAYVHEFVNRQDLSFAKISILQFADSTKIRSRLSYKSNKIHNAVNALKRHGGKLDAGAMAQRVSSVVQDGGRANAEQVLLVLTTGRPFSVSQFKSATKTLKKNKVRVIALVVGTGNHYEEYQDVVTAPAWDHYRWIAGANFLESQGLRFYFAYQMTYLNCPLVWPHTLENNIKNLIPILNRCPGRCNGHGYCINDSCYCQAGWSGNSCNQKNADHPSNEKFLLHSAGPATSVDQTADSEGEAFAKMTSLSSELQSAGGHGLESFETSTE